MLSGFGFQLACGGNKRHQGQMNQSGITASQPQAHLPDGLQKRQGFNVTYRTTNLDNSHISLPVISSLGTTGDEVLYFIGDVGDDLHGFPQIIADRRATGRTPSTWPTRNPASAW